mgnify:CR=1 FL=1
MPIKDDLLSRAVKLLSLIEKISIVGGETIPHLRSEAIADIRAIDDEIRKAKEAAQPRAIPAESQLSLPDPELGGRFAEAQNSRRPV